jgi:hypothetical protein
MAVNQVEHKESVEVEFEIGDGYEVSSAMRSMSWPLTVRSLYLSNQCPHGVELQVELERRVTSISRDRDN